MKTGESVTLKVRIKNEFAADGVDLVLRRDGSNQVSRQSFLWQETGEEYTTYHLHFCIEEAGLYFYRFEIKKSGIVHFCGKEEHSCQAAVADWLPEWQLTVYEEKFETPSWFSQGVVYQIFVDRFFKGKPADFSDISKDYVLREDWGGIPFYKREPNGDLKNNDFFGGNLDGVAAKLDYLAELGVTCIYLNPIFEAYSNHKYDTADYMNIDAMFGNTEDFKSLCANAAEKGIRIILDGVFSHTGSDSIYFNKQGRYGTGGAYNSKNSPYYRWYSFEHWPDSYDSWWGIKILPAVKEEEPSYLDFIAGEQGVLRYWLRNGASGWRLDVADELPDLFLDRLRAAVKAEKGDAVIIGEVWEDASNKESYGNRRRYLLGRQLDSVMNYVFKDAILDFVKGGRAENFEKQVNTLLQNYPAPAINCLMNIIGTHDTVRILTELSSVNKDSLTIEQRAGYQMSEQNYLQARRLLKLAAALQFTLPGVPSLYYGDEAGLQGYEDPFNRGCFPWRKEDAELLDWYKKLGNLRQKYAAAFQERMEIIHARGNMLVYMRGRTFLVAVNAGETPCTIALPEGIFCNALSQESISGSITIGDKSCGILVRIE